MHRSLGCLRFGLSNTLLELLYSGVCGCGTIGKPERKHHWEHAWRTNFEKLVIGEIGVATIGVEQHTFGASVLGCVCRCGTIGKPNDPIIGNTHVNKFPKHIIIGGFGWRRLVASNRSNGNFTNGGGGSGGGGWC